MTTIAANNPNSQMWPIWKKLLFRFFFVYFFFQFAPWTWLDVVPGFGYLLGLYNNLMDWLVDFANAKVFHIRPVLIPINGSGDTSYGWAQVCFWFSLAATGCIIWSALDRRRKNYTELNYWLCLFARYYLAMSAFTYGIVKLFAMQMYFPTLHQLATPLGDLLPMRLSWLFIGYSTTYQVFSGVMEVLAGLLLLYRRTASFGVMMATAVFTNVMMLNLSYDIPVKIFSMQLVLVCLFLLANESQRIFYFFILNKAAPVSVIYDFSYRKKWHRISRVVLKVCFVVLAIGMQFYSDLGYYSSEHKPKEKQVIPDGVYEVTSFTINKKIIPLSLSDSLRWQDVIFENNTGSIKTADTAFRQRYKRGYFIYAVDKVAQIMYLRKQDSDSLPFMNLHYQTPDPNTVKLWGKLRSDSLFVELKRINRHFQLTERQFHWLSEHNR